MSVDRSGSIVKCATRGVSRVEGPGRAAPAEGGAPDRLRPAICTTMHTVLGPVTL